MKRSPLVRRTRLRSNPDTHRAWRQRSRKALRSKRQRRDHADRPLSYWCEAGTPACTRIAAHRHHVLLRSQGGTGGRTLDVCLDCHDWIHRHPAEAYERGWLERRWSA